MASGTYYEEQAPAVNLTSEENKTFVPEVIQDFYCDNGPLAYYVQQKGSKYVFSEKNPGSQKLKVVINAPGFNIVKLELENTGGAENYFNFKVEKCENNYCFLNVTIKDYNNAPPPYKQFFLSFLVILNTTFTETFPLMLKTKNYRDIDLRGVNPKLVLYVKPKQWSYLINENGGSLNIQLIPSLQDFSVNVKEVSIPLNNLQGFSVSSAGNTIAINYPKIEGYVILPIRVTVEFTYQSSKDDPTTCFIETQ